jgi:hypothetical protein
MMKLVLAVLIVCLGLVQANSSQAQKLKELQDLMAKAKDQALNGPPKCFQKPLEAVLFEQARYLKIVDESGSSSCSDQVFLRWTDCFSYIGPKTQELKKMSKYGDPCPRIDVLNSCIGNCYTEQATKKILSAYWKVETVYVRFDSVTWGKKISGNEEIADKMEACSSPLLGSGMSKTEYPICPKSNEAIEKENINSGNVIAAINLGLIVITTIFASYHA